MHQNPSFHLKTSELVVFLFMKESLKIQYFKNFSKINTFITTFFFLFFKAFKLCVVEPGGLQ